MSQQVSIQRVHDQREIEENEIASLHCQDHDVDGTIRSNFVENEPSNKAEFETALRASSGSDITLSSSGSSSGLETPWEMQMKTEPVEYLSSSMNLGPKSDTPSPVHKEHRSSWERVRDSAPSDSPTALKETFLDEEAPDVLIKKLKAEVAVLSRQADMSELELQALRKQIGKESKRGQDHWREVVCLKQERDAFMEECELLRGKTKGNFLFDGVDSQTVVDELRQELSYAKELNTNLRVQLQKTQESNSELILAVRDLEEMLEEMDGESRQVAVVCQLNNTDDDEDDEDQKALEDIVKQHGEAEGTSVLEQEIIELQNEIEFYKRDKDELEMQMEQLALDYEVMKQANHDMACRLEQSQIHEQLKMQYECSSPDTNADELGACIEKLEHELQSRTKEYESSLLRISELQGHVASLEKEVEKQARGFEADVEALTRSKVEQEKRAIKAEETLKQMRWKNANAAERLQDEFRKLSVQMASTFEANEKLATKALAEANELRVDKARLEEMLRRIAEEHQSVEGNYEARLREVTVQVTTMSNQIERLQSDIHDRGIQLERHKEIAGKTERLLSNEISMLKEEIEEQIAKNKILLEEKGSLKDVVHELERMKMSIKEMELLVEQGNDEKVELESKVMVMKMEAEELEKELNRLRSLAKEKEQTTGNLQSELDSLRAQCMELKDSLSVNEVEKEGLTKQVLQLRSELKKKEDAYKIMERKTRDGSGRATAADAVKTGPKTSKPIPRRSKEASNLKEKIKLLECEINLKETALEKSAHAFSEKEKVLHKKIEELEERLNVNEVEKPLLEDQASKGRLSEEEAGNSSSDIEELKNEMGLVMERNKSMEKELKEMHERYSDMSLKFAEVEGERQQLVMKLRNLKNTSPSKNMFA
ncbi:centrosomal protein of 83 kDa-like isoform X2 [Salvia splendens]|uniref:centrosomal protein of 83 kDa-like isoform X2 n=1 Tax=Salvia splendens TaxID=180675 RepID=UPI001C258632|nr:centrosomal protein of 83 kDa-like isoform X2 [Salvia splendens]